MEKILNPSAEQKEFFINKIPPICRAKFKRIMPDGSKIGIESVFDLNEGDHFVRIDRLSSNLVQYKQNQTILVATSNPYVNSNGSPAIECVRLKIAANN